MLKRNMRPARPGAILDGIIEGFHEKRGHPYTVTGIAEGLGVSRRMISMIINQKAGISPEMAVKLSEAFAINANLWMNLQKKYDLWQAEKKVDRQSVRHFLQGNAGLNRLNL